MTEMTGRIHSLETMGTVDGPGIRTVVFFQGCPLRCLYCHNPDTWDPGGGEIRRVDELMAMIRRFRPYFAASGGGVTLSGGEPGLQPAFAAALLSACQNEGIHTAIDTSGHMEDEAADRLLAHADLVILDIKHTDPIQHLRLTGQSLEKTLAFAQRTEALGIPLWIRQVLLPGWTDALQQLQNLADFCAHRSNLKRLELLPYHGLGIYKWEALKIPYALNHVQPPTDTDLKKAVQILSKKLPALPVMPDFSMR